MHTRTPQGTMATRPRAIVRFGHVLGVIIALALMVMATGDWSARAAQRRADTTQSAASSAVSTIIPIRKQSERVIKQLLGPDLRQSITFLIYPDAQRTNGVLVVRQTSKPSGSIRSAKGYSWINSARVVLSKMSGLHEAYKIGQTTAEGSWVTMSSTIVEACNQRSLYQAPQCVKTVIQLTYDSLPWRAKVA